MECVSFILLPLLPLPTHRLAVSAPLPRNKLSGLRLKMESHLHRGSIIHPTSHSFNMHVK